MAIGTISNTGGNWNSSGTWVGGGIPGVNDDVVAVSTSGPLTVTSNVSANTVNFTNYVGTFSVNSGFSLTIVTSFIMVAGMTVSAASTGTLTFNTSATVTSGGKTWPGNLNFAASGNRSYTLGDAWTVSGNLTIRSSLNGSTVNMIGNSITVRGNIDFGFAGASNVITSTTNIIAAPLALTTCTISTPNTGAGQTIMRCPLTLNGAGNIVFSTPVNSSIELATVTYTAGSVSMSSTTELRWVVASTLSFNGITLAGIIRFNGTATFTLSNSMVISGNLIFGNTSANVNPTLNGSSITLTGDLSTSSSTGAQIVSGTTLLNITGSLSNLSLSGATLAGGGRFALSTTFNTSGSITYNTNVSYGGAGITLSHTAGTVSPSLNSLTWTTVTGTTIYNINSTGLSFPVFRVNAALTFTGSQGVTFLSYTSSTAGITHTFRGGITYVITDSISLTANNSSRISFVSSSSGSQSVITVLQGASLDVGYVNATDIDSSAGQTIWSYRGTLSNSNNWQQLPTQPKTVAYFNV